MAFESDVGRSRSENQDFGFAGPLPGIEGWALLAVADGLGGHAHGEWASERAIGVVLEALPDLLRETTPAEALERAITAANRTVYNEARDNRWFGSATTLVLALVHAGEAWWANVGDSRIYGRFAGRLEQLSFDHSVVAEQVRAGLIAPEDAASHPHRNVVTRTVGFEPWVEADIAGPLPLARGDALLLSSDGLHGVVELETIEKVLAGHEPGEAAKRLIALANKAGGPDNITVAIGRAEGPG